MSEKPLLSYDFAEINHEPMIQFQVRSSSKKEKINLNKALTFYMQHGKSLYTITDKLKKVDDNV